jgi:hypothetical protein
MLVPIGHVESPLTSAGAPSPCFGDASRASEDHAGALADDGIKWWTVDMNAMTMTFYDRAGDALLAERIE